MVRMIYTGGIDQNNNRLRTFLLDTGDTTNDLPTATDGKGFGKAVAGDTAVDADATCYVYFENAGWVEV